jgi:hypothetical protein
MSIPYQIGGDFLTCQSVVQHLGNGMTEAGGWQDKDTMLRCYDLPDESDLLAVTSESRKRLDSVRPEWDSHPPNGLTKRQSEEQTQKPGVTEVIAGRSIAPPRLELGLS